MVIELCKVGKVGSGESVLIKSYACDKIGLPSLPKDYFSRLSRPVFHCPKYFYKNVFPTTHFPTEWEVFLPDEKTEVVTGKHDVM